MPRTLTVREVREEIYRAAGGREGVGTGERSTAALGRWFHEVFAHLLGPGCRQLRRDAVSDAEGDVAKVAALLQRNAYDRVVGPRMGRFAPELASETRGVLALWEATGHLCRWMAEACVKLEAPSEEAITFDPEHELAWEVSDPAWSDSVNVVGVADALFQDRKAGRWCVGELKLGRGAPEADLAQSCLYYQMLASAMPDGGDLGALVLMSFTPTAAFQLFTKAEIEAAFPALKALIGRMAGVALPARAVLAPQADDTRYADLAKRLERAFEEYGTPVRVLGTPIVGPAFLRFLVDPRRSVKPKQVQAQADALRVRLELEAPPFIGFEGGRIAVDLQRKDRQDVLFADVLDRLPQADAKTGSPKLVFGVNLQGNVELADLSDANHAHILVAGTTGSGKSEWLRTAVASLIVRNTPETLRLVVIDPKRNAFADLKGSHFLLDEDALVYPGDRDPIEVLDTLVDAMEARYRKFEGVPADDLAEFVARTGETMPRIVCVCDEYADLVSGNRKQREAVEERICRLGAKARAAGVHLLFATQQPSREVIKGRLDTNMPCRVALKTSKLIESRMLLGEGGAENLLGRGDALVKDVGSPRRVQTPFLDAETRRAIFCPDHPRR